MSRFTSVILGTILFNFAFGQVLKQISPAEFKRWQAEKVSYQLIDVRTPAEYKAANLGGELMPLQDLEAYISKISKTKKVVVHCKAGERSAKAIKLLQKKYGFKNLYNLTGGIEAYKAQDAERK